MLPTEVRLVAELTRRAESVATAESLTAGLVAGAIASVPGASAVLRGGVVTYAVDTKASVLGVSGELLAAGGPVQAAVAEQMAVGARRMFGATYGLATTGVAGPDPDGDAPVGRVFIAVASADEVRSRKLQLDGDRGRIRRATMHAVIGELLDDLLAAAWE